jgi:predicted dehydrogenase
MGASRRTAAVIGVGRMGVRHLTALTGAGIDVVAIADADTDTLNRARFSVPGAAAYTDWAALFAEHRPDLVTVATTSPAHESVVVAASQAGVSRVLCEKPIATSLRAARAIEEACHRHGTRLVVNHPRRLVAAYLAVREAIAADRFGDLRFMRVTCGAAGLANVGSHAFDLMRWFLGAPQTAIGRLEANTPPNPRGAAFHDPGGHGTFWFADDRRATFDFCNDFSTSFVAEFGCRYGSITVDERNGAIHAFARTDAGRTQSLHLYQTPTAPVPLPFGAPIDIVQLTAAMIDNALSDAPPACTGEDGIAALEMVAAVHLSHRANAPVAFPVPDDEGCIARIP